MTGSNDATNRPFNLLSDSLGKEVLVFLKGDVSLRGSLKAYDVHLNLILENAEQLVDGQVKTKFGKLFVRGDSVILLSP